MTRRGGSVRSCMRCNRSSVATRPSSVVGWAIVDAVDLGRGKRLVTRGGKLDKRYQITVPEAFYAG